MSNFHSLVSYQSRKLLQSISLLCALLLSPGDVLVAWSHSSHIEAIGVPARQLRLLYLPLDERFTTRDLFLSYARITPFQVLTPDKAMLPRKKSLPDLKALLDWTERVATETDAAMVSADMLLYGGLIASRTSHGSLNDVRARLRVLESIRRENPRLPLFVSTTVMRMPSYSSAEEEPDYYARYGRAIFLFSQHSHRYEALHEPQDKATAESYKSQIPAEVLADYLSRRERNFIINQELIELVKKNVINRLVITLDDNAEYGFFKKEAAALERRAAPVKDRIAIYPGADEAQLTLLSRLVLGTRRIPVYVAYRFPEAKRLIPAFEGQPLEESVNQQILAAGGAVVEDQSKAACVLYVNNFAGKQTFAGGQPATPVENGEPLENWLSRAGVKPVSGKPFILADNCYYNGSDTQMVAAILASKLKPDRVAYAGWNTSGNTLGSAIALGLLRMQMRNNEPLRLQYKKLLWARLMEDWVYMVDGREELKRDLQRQGLTSFAGTRLEAEYESRMKALFNSRAHLINRFLQTNFVVEKVFSPWHRAFEIGFEVGER